MEPNHEKIPVYRQCELLGLNRSSLYYQPTGESDYNEQVMRIIDEQYVVTPFYGVDKMTAWLQHQGYPVYSKRVRRLIG